MKRLSKTQENERIEHQQAIGKAKDELEKAIDTFNHELEDAKVGVQVALDKLNGTIENAENWRAEIVSAMEEYEGERSDKWQESDAGQSYSAWKDSWSEEITEVELELPEPLDMPDCGVDDALGELPEEP